MAGEKNLDRVVVLKGFQNGQIGNKEVDAEFDYDMAKDPLGLKALGLVRKVKVEAAAEPKA